MKRNLKQIIPSSVCLSCDVCCRYLERTTVLTPTFLPEEIKENKIVADRLYLYTVGKKIDPRVFPLPYKDSYICPFFLPEQNMCRIYLQRPFDCQLYPLMLTYGPDFKEVQLVLDRNCLYFQDKLNSKEFKEYLDYLTKLLEDEGIVEEINANKNFINDFQEGSLILKRLDKLSKRLCLSGYGLRKISLKDKEMFDEYCAKINTNLSSFAFAAIYIWGSALNILWKKIDRALCIFAGNDQDYFLLLPPLDDKFNKTATKKALELLVQLNKNGAVAPRIENVPQEFSEQMAACGLKLKMTSQEYIYRQKDLAQLKGENYKAKRSAVNKFCQNYQYSLRPLQKDDIFKCLDLYRTWAKQRLKNKKDEYYRLLIEDSYFAQKIALFNLKSLNLTGEVVEVNGEIKGYSLGLALNKDVFVILFETTDLNIRGLAQFLFKQFSRQLYNYPNINTLSDSGLENLKKVKDSYRPTKKIPVFCASA